MKKILFLSILALTSLISCDQDEPLQTGPNATIIGFAKSSVVTANFTDVATEELTIPLSYVSYQNETIPSDDVTVTWEIDAANSTAVEGFEFDFTSTSKQITIAGGQTVAVLPITGYPINYDVNNATKLVLKLTAVNSNNAIIGSQYSTVELTFRGVCPSNLAGNYDVVVTIIAGNGLGNVYNLPGEVIAEIGNAQYAGNSIGPYNSRGLISAGAQIPGVGLIFDDICNNITLYKDADWSAPVDTGVAPGQGQYLGPYYNPVYQTPALEANSSVDPITGVITIEYNIWFGSGTRTYRGVYTPQ